MRGNKKLVGESTPAYVFYLDFIDNFYPGIKKICIIRNPKDRVVSWHFNQIRKGRKTEMKILDEFALDYCKKRIMKEYESLLNYNGRVHCLTYEKLSADSEAVIKDMLKYLGVETDDSVVFHMIKEGSFRNLVAKDTGSEIRERGEESLTSHYRKGTVGDWEKHLTIEQARMIDDLLLDLQKKVFKKFNLF